MKTFIAVTVLTLGLAMSGKAAEFKGFVEDSHCAENPGMKANAACALKCIKGGAPAVLVSENGTVYKIANQDKIVQFAGRNVTVKGNATGDTITVKSVR